MSAADDKKAKRRKIKKSPVAKNPLRSSTCQNGTEAKLSNSPTDILSPAIDSEVVILKSFDAFSEYSVSIIYNFEKYCLVSKYLWNVSGGCQ